MTVRSHHLCQHLDEHLNNDCHRSAEIQVAGVWRCWDHDRQRTARLAVKLGRPTTVDESRFLV